MRQRLVIQRELFMPTVLRSGPYRFFFYSGDRKEPPHIHIERDDRIAKYWLNPARLQSAGGFNQSELRQIHAIIKMRHRELMEAWNENFSN
jgi:hypothetical protein